VRCLIPIYEFVCKKCKKKYETLASHDPKGKYPGVECEYCGSKKKEKLLSSYGVSFTDPKESSKWDNFGYRAGFNMDKAKKERMHAEKHSRVGNSKDIYGEY
jgi:putative FmdB family regulatory protein